MLEGIAADGGLYIRDDLSTMNFDWKGLLGEDSLTMSARILSALLPDIPDMETLVKQGYEGKFETDELTPLRAGGRPLCPRALPRPDERVQGRRAEPAAAPDYLGQDGLRRRR